MKNNSRLYSILILCSLLLPGCTEHEKNYSYYMQHPLELKQEITECQSSFGQGKNATKCEMIMHAAVNMTAIVNQQQADPEQFGQRVLDAEERLMQLRLAVIEAHQVVVNLNSKQVTPTELRVAQDNLDKAKKACKDQHQEIKVLLAVLGMSSPD